MIYLVNLNGNQMNMRKLKIATESKDKTASLVFYSVDEETIRINMKMAMVMEITGQLELILI
jgi:hypothetical protein